MRTTFQIQPLPRPTITKLVRFLIYRGRIPLVFQNRSVYLKFSPHSFRFLALFSRFPKKTLFLDQICTSIGSAGSPFFLKNRKLRLRNEKNTVKSFQTEWDKNYGLISRSNRGQNILNYLLNFLLFRLFLMNFSKIVRFSLNFQKVSVNFQFNLFSFPSESFPQWNYFPGVTGRRIHKASGRSYHIKYKPPHDVTDL